MKLYDTSLKTYADFAPDHLVRIYVCGITPYDSAHLGHIFTFMTYDLLLRRLQDLGHEVQLVRNITDVDEPIYVKARELGVPYTELAAREAESFMAVLERLNFKHPHAEPRASEYITQMSEAVQKLLNNGFAYRLEDDIYYDVTKFPDFDKFAALPERLMLGFSRDRGGDPDRPGKRHPLDFLLWKGVTDSDDPAQWQTVVGNGRPGWHIECSVMSSEILGVPFDLHGGGADLIYPHHSAEIAQSYGLGHPELAKHWLHVSPMLYIGEKMSKSLGNLVFAKDLLEDYEPAAVRLALMHYHYRLGGEWLPEYMDEASELLSRLQTVMASPHREAAEKLLEQVRDGLDDDLDTPFILESLQLFAASEPASELDHEAHEAAEKAFSLLGLI